MAREYDRWREDYISSFGVTFLRFTNLDMYESVEGVLGVVLEKLKKLKKDQR